MIAYIARRAWNVGAACEGALLRWFAAQVVAPRGSTYDRIDQEIEGRVITPARWQ